MFLLFLLVSLLCLVKSDTIKCHPDTKRMWSCHDLPPVDSCCLPSLGVVALALQWMPGYGPEKEFTLHGLWPDFCNGTFPTNGCDSSRTYSTVTPHLPKPLVEQMNTYWPSFKGDNDVFWSGQWKKHGTCISTLEPRCYPSYKKGQELADYYKKALQLRKEYDIYGALADEGIVPIEPHEVSYSVDRMKEAIMKKYKVRPKMLCRNSTLYEVMLSFHVIGKDWYAPVDFPRESECPPLVAYPKKYIPRVGKK